MTWLEVRFTGINLPVHELDQLEARLVELYEYLLGDDIRSDIRINLWKPVQLIGGELTPLQESLMIDEVLHTIYSVSGPLNPGDEPRIEFVSLPETPREEIQKQIADHRFQISERRKVIEDGGDPVTVAMLTREIERLEVIIAELESQLEGMDEENEGDSTSLF